MSSIFVFPLCMGMVGKLTLLFMAFVSFSPIHGDGWSLPLPPINVSSFFPYAWGWLETNKENTEESVFPYAWG